jgi:hypothetical protein
MPLAPLPLASQSYELTSRPGSAARLLNMMAEPLPPGSRSPFMLKPTPGLRLVQAVGNGPIRAMASIPAYLYVISGSHAYRIQAGGFAPVDLGDIGVLNAGPSQTDLRPTIAVGADQTVIVVPPRAYVCNHNGLLQEITTGNGNFPPEGASSVATIDGYFVFTSFTGEYFFCSNLLTGLNFDSLDYSQSARRPDYVRKAVVHNGELWLFGQDSSSVWYDAGAADFPFRERAGSTLEAGLGSYPTLTSIDGSLFFLGSDRVVYRTQGYQAVRISTHPIEEQLSRYLNVAEITACAFVYEGHACYSLSLPNAAGGGRTFVYDAETKVWHERSSAPDGLGRWRAECAVQWGTVTLLGDATIGGLFAFDPDLGQDNQAYLYRQAVLPAIVTHGPRAFMSRLEVEMEVGTVGQPYTMALDWSDDGGLNWSAQRPLELGASGDTLHRVVYNRLGSFRQRSLRLSGTGRLTIFGVDADVIPGAV